MRVLTLLIVTACTSKSAPVTLAPPSIESADITKLRADPADGFNIHFDAGDSSAAEVKKFDGDKSSRYDLWPWNTKWPSDLAGFTAKLAQPDFIDERYSYDVTKSASTTDDTWEFRGKVVFSGDHSSEPVFIVVRTFGSKRFVCLGRNVATDWAMNAAVASCRSLRAQ